MARVPPPDSPDDFPLPEQDPAELPETLAEEEFPLAVDEPVGPDNSAALLAELDVLLERMMALPVNESAEETPGGRRTEEPPEYIPVITVAEAMPESQPIPAPVPADDLYYQTFLEHRAEDSPPAESDPFPEATRPPEPVAIWHRPREDRDPEVPPPFVSRTPPPSGREVPAPPPPEPETPPLWVVPLVGCELLFRGVTALLGPAGRGLRHPVSRSFLALAGVAMLAAAGGVVLGDYLGWTW